MEAPLWLAKSGAEVRSCDVISEESSDAARSLATVRSLERCLGALGQAQGLCCRRHEPQARASLQSSARPARSTGASRSMG